MRKTKEQVCIADPLMDKSDVAKALGVTERSIERYVAKRLIPQPIQLTPRAPLRLRRSTIEAFIARQEQLAAKSA